ncbi:MAG: hypothetical protein WAS73_15545 [Defluviicoccus sp.]
MSETAARAETTPRPEAASPADAATQLLGTLERLARILSEENAALKARQGERVRAGLADKVAAATTYAQAVKAFQQLGPRRSELAAALRGSLEAGVRRLHELVAENSFHLDVSRTAQRRLIDHIVEAAKGLSEGPGTYSRAGRVTRNAGGKAAPPPALSLNQAF